MEYRICIYAISWMFFSCERCVLSGRGFYEGPITCLEESYRLWCVLACDIDTSRMRKPRHPLVRTSIGGKIENKYQSYNIRLCLSPERLSITRVISIDIRPATYNLTREADRNRRKVPNDILFLSGFKNRDFVDEIN
jgi:hypothetical protein